MERTAPVLAKPARKSELFKFAVFPNYDESLGHLANHLAQPENWAFSDPAQEIAQGNMLAKYTFPVLRSYLENTFRKLQEEGKVLKTEDQHHACFNTGLVTSHFEDIYAFFARNRYTNQETPYYLIGFIRKSDHEYLRHFSMNPPKPANYFTRPEELLFNPNLEIIPDVDHIISGNRARFPEAIAARKDDEIRTTLVGAIAESAKRVRVNYMIAMPQYFRGAIQLLVPLYMTSRERPDLALVLEKINTRAYSARTCLTMGMAYNNTRLIARPQGTQWLAP